MRAIFSILALCCVATACSKSKPEPPPQVAATSAPAAATAPAHVDEEPPEHVLRELMFRQYAALEEGGGLPATVTATGHTGTIRAKLHEVHKEKCVQLPVDPPGVYECGVQVMVAMWWEGKQEFREPSSDAKRISVIRDHNGIWIDCTYNSDRTSICQTGKKK